MVFNFLKRREKNKVTFLGLDSSGKSTIISFLQTGHFVEHTPTMGKSRSDIEVQGNRFSIYDMGGQSDFRKLWMGELSNTKLVIFVVDIANESRFPEAKKELKRLIGPVNDHKLSLFVIANKVDLPNSTAPNDLIDILDLYSFNDFAIRETSAKTGFGMADCFADIYSKLTGERIKRNNIARAISLYDSNGTPIILQASEGEDYDQAVLQGGFLSAITSFIQNTHGTMSSQMKIDLGEKVFIVRRNNGFIGAIYWDDQVGVSLEEADEGLHDLLSHLDSIAHGESKEKISFHFTQYCSNLL